MKRAVFAFTPMMVIIISFLMILNHFIDFCFANEYRLKDEFNNDVNAFVQYLNDNIPAVKAQHTTLRAINKVAAVAQVITLSLYALGQLKRNGVPKTEIALAMSTIYCIYGAICYKATPVVALVTEWVTQTPLSGVGILVFVYVTYKVMM